MAYGFGDGGGPEAKMIEMARRVEIWTMSQGEHVNVGQFMTELEKESVNPPVYRGTLFRAAPRYPHQST